MYSRGSNAYGQQLYGGGQQAYGQNSGAAFSGSTIGALEGGRHSSMLGTGQDADLAAYRTAASYGGQYGDVYGSSALNSAQQVGQVTGKVGGSSSLQGRAGYSSAMAESPKFVSERRNYNEQNTFGGRDLQSDAARRYVDSVGLLQNQAELYDHIDQASLLRQQQLLKSQSIQSASLDGSARQADYLAAREAALRHANQDLASYGARMDADPRSLAMIGGSSYSAQHQASILGAAPRRNVDDLMYPPGSSSAGYGVSLPPGRDYAAGKVLRGSSLESDYPSSLLSRPSIAGSRIDERKEDRDAYRREHDIREEERRRDHLREREREREREERERERERERKRGRERLLERRDKERERERKRGLEVRRERTPPRVTRERQGSSLVKEERSLRRGSPRHDSLHRRHSPVREKRRDYICKVFPATLVEVERDYLSISKRYPKLSISPEFSKVILNWPKHNLNLSLQTPVSFEHDLIEIENKAEQKDPSSGRLAEEHEQSRVGSTVWNAKVVLMSGISKDALDDLSSDKSYDDRIPHISNILRFAFLRKDRSFMAIGGPWDSVDGGDPSVDDTSLVRTALRYVKDSVKLDLQNCQNWNRFLEIHYDRVGKDGLFSHREVTVLYIPDLSECLPSLNEWRDQWFAHRKVIIEKERNLALLKEKKSAEKDKAVKGDKSNKKADKDKDSTKNASGKKEKKEAHAPLSDQAADGKQDRKKSATEVQDNAAEKQKGVDEGKVGEDGMQVDNKEQDTVAQVTDQKPVKKKIVKKVVKQKVVGKKPSGDVVSKESEKLDEKDTGDKQDTAQDSPANVKTVKKKIVKKVLVGKSALKEDKDVNSDDQPAESKSEKVLEDKPGENADNNTFGTKKVLKKKIIKRVPKKKVTGADDIGQSGGKLEGDKVETKSEPAKANEHIADVSVPTVEGNNKSGKKTNSKSESKALLAEKHADDATLSGKEVFDDKGKKEGKGLNDKKEIETKPEKDSAKGKGSSKDIDGKKEKAKDEKEKKGKDSKDESGRKSSKDTREKGKSEEPPKHAGLILQTKWTKESKLRSTSLSLDSLLDYTDKDIEESTFELSLFAEALYEMLQFQMGCRLLEFLKKLRLHFVNKRNIRKRQREENPQKESDQVKSSRKRPRKTAELPVKNESDKSEIEDASKSRKEGSGQEGNEEETEAKEQEGVENSSIDDEGDDYDPEEDEDQDMDDASHDNDSTKEAGDEEKVTGDDAKPKEDTADQKVETKEGVEDTTPETGGTHLEKSKDKEAVTDTEEKAMPAAKERIVDTDLLQAFRFFDRNRVGYIKVEDLRLIIHNLGKFLSHRDVKELVQSALLESNSARDNRILYNKLVRQ